MKSFQSNRWQGNRVFQMPKMTKFWDRLYPNFGSAKIKPISTIPLYVSKRSSLKLKLAKRFFGSKKTFRAKIELKITQEKLRCKLDFLKPLEKQIPTFVISTFWPWNPQFKKVTNWCQLDGALREPTSFLLISQSEPTMNATINSVVLKRSQLETPKVLRLKYPSTYRYIHVSLV